MVAAANLLEFRDARDVSGVLKALGGMAIFMPGISLAAAVGLRFKGGRGGTAGTSDGRWGDRWRASWEASSLVRRNTIPKRLVIVA